jgi:hypothetical protein
LLSIQSCFRGVESLFCLRARLQPCRECLVRDAALAAEVRFLFREPSFFRTLLGHSAQGVIAVQAIGDATPKSTSSAKIQGKFVPYYL